MACERGISENLVSISHGQTDATADALALDRPVRQEKRVGSAPGT